MNIMLHTLEGGFERILEFHLKIVELECIYIPLFFRLLKEIWEGKELLSVFFEFSSF